MAKNAKDTNGSREESLLQVDQRNQPCSTSTSSEDTGGGGSGGRGHSGHGDYVTTEDDMAVVPVNKGGDQMGSCGGGGGPAGEGTWNDDKQPLSSSSTTTSSSEDTEDIENQIPPQSCLANQKPHRSLSSSSSPEVVPMTIDTCEDLWTRLHDIRINGCVLEYVGRGKSIYDNGLAQSNTPLTPMNHYYEVTILHPGENCYIAIGLARKDYPSHKHPGWNRGSVAYHADDGKIFIGSGIGTPFGPRCHLNDVLGCGIVFPSHLHNSYSIPAKDRAVDREMGGAGIVPVLPGPDWPWDGGKAKVKKSPRPKNASDRDHGHMDNILEASSESEDDIWWNNKNQVYEDKVQVFFMRNSKLLGMKEIRIPKGGFYPTIGMMSRNEKVMIDMNPLTG